jgi:hypothetical protein
MFFNAGAIPNYLLLQKLHLFRLYHYSELLK